jgi:hypothetical protein
MYQETDEFDPSPFVQREPEVLTALAMHICALSRQKLARLEVEGGVLLNIQALEEGDDFGLHDLCIAFVQSGETIRDVEDRVGMEWISSFAWLSRDAESNGPPTDGSTDLNSQEVIARILSSNWYELVLWELEERWLSET